MRRPLRRIFGCFAFLALPPALLAGAGSRCPMADDAAEVRPPEKLPAPEAMTGIGNVQMRISSRNPQAQVWFNQGLNLFDDFWDYESARAFEQAIRVDPNCAICYWGLYEAETFRDRLAKPYAAAAIERAQALKSHASRQERLYIEAAAAEQAAKDEAEKSGDDPDTTDEIAAWRKAVRNDPHDTNARLFLAESLGDGYNDDGTARDGQKEARQVIQSVLKDQPDNSAAHHFWIHAVEAGNHPEEALHSAEVLGSLAPNSGHMVHMPGHIYYRIGEYSRAQAAFDASTAVDEHYLRTQHVPVDDDWNYVHNLMYSVANLLEEGRMAEAAEVSAKLSGARGHLEDTLYPWSARDAISRIDPQLPIALRAGDYPRILELVNGAEDGTRMQGLPNLRFLADNLRDFASGMEAARSGNGKTAQEKSTLLDASLWRESQKVNDAEDRDEAAKPGMKPLPFSQDAEPKPLVSTLSILSLELRGATLVAERQVPEAEKLFSDAQQEETALGYREPPSFIRPVGETEAAVMLSAHEYAQARAGYERALRERPNSGFPLYGLAQVDEAAGDHAAAMRDYGQFMEAWANADPGLPELAHARGFLGREQAARQ